MSDLFRLTLERLTFSDKSTIGTLSDNQTKICDMLERPWLNGRNLSNSLGDAGNNSSAILSGVYEVKKVWSPKNNRYVPELQSVPGRYNIQIHPGNKPGDSLGCLLPGTYNPSTPDFVASSRIAFDYLYSILEKQWNEGAKVLLEIKNTGLKTIA